MRDLSPRHIRFVSEYLKSQASNPSGKGNASRAYMLAGYNPSTRNSLDVNASRLLKHPKIKSALDVRRQAMLKRSDFTLEKFLKDAEAARELALRIDQPSAATGATTLQAKLLGVLVDRKEQGAPGDFAGLTTPDEVLAAIRSELGEGAANALQAMLGKASPPLPPPELAEPAPIATASGTDSLN